MKIKFTAILICLLMSVSTTAQITSRLNIMLDTSGSMSRYNSAIAHSILSIKEHSAAHPTLTENINLFSFTNQTEFILEGNSDDVFSRIKYANSKGGVEDGLIAIKHIVMDPFIKDSHIILFTDEGRDVVENIDLDNLITLANEKNITIHTVLKTFIETQNDDYIKLALATNGKVWSIRDLLNKQNKSIRKQALRKPNLADNDQDNFSLFIANELYNTYERNLYAKMLITGELSLGSIISIDANNVIEKQGVDPVESWEWDFDNDGSIDDYGPLITFNIREQDKNIKLITLWLSSKINGQIIREKQEVSFLIQ
ncbi:hypothetical protein KO527_22685 [Pseudoalteromonas sp. C2R02]|uniref:hypothetical protein n=1 Tax=Pseudoalteromonas sp. C2R02 TaxID=2841565 RepID=UPI001C090299|nr:hypothetical protein [Pseudoalteromonas sp. C2R02]MBU2972149.1 hypothetical protein [Pseudoalteromonas sp. C2R02]